MPLNPAIPARLGSLAAMLWVGLLLFAPWSATRASTGGPASMMAAAVYAVSSLVCHQRPERSLHVGAAQMPVCARCAGLYAGAAAVAVITRLGRRPPAGGLQAARWRLAAAAAANFFTVLAEWAGLPVGNGARLAAGAALGAAAGWAILALLWERDAVEVN